MTKDQTGNEYGFDFLPWNKEIAFHYEALDLPYGAPLEEVTARWKKYSAVCRPARYMGNAEKQEAAQKLSRIFDNARNRIKEAWDELDGKGSKDGASNLPWSDDLARCYQALDLPYGAPPDQVTAQWKSYIKKCHPDRHLSNPDILPDANKLTRILTEAHDKIKDAWRQGKI